MSTTTTRQATRVDSPEGTIRVYVPGQDDTPARSAARSLACKIHGGVTVGRTPAGVKANRGHVYTFSPVAVVRPARPTAKPAKPAKPAKADDRLAYLTRELARVTAELAKVQGKPAPVAKPAREVPPAIAARIAASHAITCKTCRDLKVVRGVGSRAGQPYRTADGAAAAKQAGRAVPCPTHVKARKTA